MKHWNNVGEITLHSEMGGKTVYPSLEDFVSRQTDRFITENISDVPKSGRNFIDLNGHSRVVFTTRAYWVTDELGIVVPVWKIREVAERTEKQFSRRSRVDIFLRRSGTSWDYDGKFRNSPVPGTGKRKRKYLSLRKPRTIQEKRENCLCKSRSKRMNVPDSYDDIIRSDRRNKSWKRHRKTQYRDKSETTRGKT